jgi:predicted kinase
MATRSTVWISAPRPSESQRTSTHPTGQLLPTTSERLVDHFPTPHELWAVTFAVPNAWRERFAQVPFEDRSGSWDVRYYQDTAIQRVLEAVADERQRILLTLATGTGKTTLARKLEAALPSIRLSADDWMGSLEINLHAEPERDRIEALQWQVAQRLLALGNVVIVEWGTWGKWDRDRLRLRARELGALVEIHYLTASLEELYRRIQLRNTEDPPISWETVQKWGSIFEVPTQEELDLFDPPLLSSDTSTANA